MRVVKLVDIADDEVFDALRVGKTIVYPTETCYGLGCDATNAEAVEKIYKIKQRPKDKSFIVIASDLAMMEPYVEMTPMLKEILNKYKDQALTVVVDSHHPTSLLAVCPSSGMRGQCTIAFRVTSNPFARKLVKKFGKPIISTSANLAGGSNPYTFQEVLNNFQNQSVQPDILIDAGDLPVRPPSTVISLKDGKIEVLRQGELKIPSIF